MRWGRHCVVGNKISYCRLVKELGRQNRYMLSFVFSCSNCFARLRWRYLSLYSGLYLGDGISSSSPRASTSHAAIMRTIAIKASAPALCDRPVVSSLMPRLSAIFHIDGNFPLCTSVGALVPRAKSRVSNQPSKSIAAEGHCSASTARSEFVWKPTSTKYFLPLYAFQADKNSTESLSTLV